MGLIQILDVAWVLSLAFSFVYMVVAASRVRRALEGLSTLERAKVLFGSTTPNLSGGQRSTVWKCRVALACFLILLTVPPLLLRGALKSELVDAEHSRRGAQASAGRSDIFASGRLQPVELVAGGFGISVEDVSNSGSLHEAGIRSGETIVSIDGEELATMAEAAKGILAIGANRFNSLRIRESNGKERTISR